MGLSTFFKKRLILKAISKFFLKEKIRLIDLRHEEPTLEDAFVELTGRGLEE
jgi:hypothetical protein